MLGVFASLEDAGNVVSAIVAAGLVPATLEMMDHLTVNAVEDAMACGFPREAGAVLIIELDGLSDGMEETAEQIATICRANGALEVRVAKDEAEREALWTGRRGAFAAITRLAPSYLSMDGTVPRTEAARSPPPGGGDRPSLRVPDLLRASTRVTATCIHWRCSTTATSHSSTNAEAASLDILRMCVELGGTVSGEHGIGIEKLEAMHFVFDENDLRAQGFVKDAFDPGGLSNPGKVLPGPVAGAGTAGLSARSEAVVDA